jgi:putative YphP/YqiW family bacilliredoxin
MPYPEQMVAPMREELSSAGALELRTEQEANAFFANKEQTGLVLINSVCGCAAGSARPAVRMSMDHANAPARFATVFAGQDLEATEKVRALLGEVPPSSPSMALLKNGELVHFVPRHMIEGRDAQTIASDLTLAFDEFCSQE